MSTYFWDLGFDFNAVKDDITQQSFLQHGFVLIQPLNAQNQAVNVPATPVNLSVNDLICFNVFNVTDQPTGTFSVTGGSITFKSAVTNQVVTSPFDSPSISIDASSSTGTGPSVIFSGIQATQVPAANPATFPVYAGPANQTVVNNGRFLMHVSLEVEGPDGNGGTTKKTFVVDPEMVIGSVG